MVTLFKPGGYLSVQRKALTLAAREGCTVGGEDNDVGRGAGASDGEGC